MGQPAGPIGKAGWRGQAAVWRSVGLDVFQPVLEFLREVAYNLPMLGREVRGSCVAGIRVVQFQCLHVCRSYDLTAPPLYGTQGPQAEVDVPTRRRHAILERSDRVPSDDDPVARKLSGQHRLQETAALPTRVEVLAELAQTRGAVGGGCRSGWSGADVAPARPAAHWTAEGSSGRHRVATLRPKWMPDDTHTCHGAGLLGS